MAEPVSILIPAYHERFFPEALASALSQQYADFEIVVCDDSAGTAIERCVQEARSPRTRYVRNPARQGFQGNFTRCLAEACADLVKFVNDDDRLHPDCIATFAGMFAANPSITLATSRRTVIDEAGLPQPDVAATTPLSHVSALMLGRELGDFVLVNSLNLIGEPSTAMFRRSHLQAEEGSIFRWGGVDYHCLADLALWLRLLARGFAYYHAAPLSEYRMHAGQEQDRGDMRVRCLEERLWIARQARLSGFLSTAALWTQAMGALRDRLAAFGPPPSYPPEFRARLERVGAELEAHAPL